jgi:hypothetical protein
MEANNTSKNIAKLIKIFVLRVAAMARDLKKLASMFIKRKGNKMENIKGFWVDENNNKWSKKTYSLKHAIKLSASLLDCTDCTDCIDCKYCTGCTGCTDCKYCKYCTGCNRCIEINRCTGFQDNPHRYTGGRIGSRNEQTRTYWSNDLVQVVCGCFVGSLEEFNSRVESHHSEDSEYRKQYKEYIKIVKTIIEMESETNGDKQREGD